MPDMSAELLGENSLLSACWKRILSVLLCSSEPHLWLKKQESTFKFRESISIICSLVIKPYPFFFLSLYEMKITLQQYWNFVIILQTSRFFRLQVLLRRAEGTAEYFS